MSCACGNAADYDACCGRFHRGEWPATVEQLMRSRYTAFTRGDWAYLATTQTQPFDGGRPQLAWVGLTVHDATEDEVEFTARHVEGEREVSLRERSKFVRSDEGRWLYATGTNQVTARKLGRNEPCPCGSGKKLKTCHG